MEEAHGVEGYVETQAGLEKISEQKATVDEGKKGMLDEISQTVAGITAKIKERQAELAPRIQARKDAKQRLVDLETGECPPPLREASSHWDCGGTPVIPCLA